MCSTSQPSPLSSCPALQTTESIACIASWGKYGPVANRNALTLDLTMEFFSIVWRQALLIIANARLAWESDDFLRTPRQTFNLKRIRQFTWWTQGIGEKGCNARTMGRGKPVWLLRDGSWERQKKKKKSDPIVLIYPLWANPKEGINNIQVGLGIPKTTGADALLSGHDLGNGKFHRVPYIWNIRSVYKAIAEGGIKESGPEWNLIWCCGEGK